jgi:hypothetical protein
MSNAFAIAAVSAVLQHFLGNAMGDVSTFFGGGAVTISSKAPDLVQFEIGSGATAQNQVNIFLHQVTYNTGWRNVCLPSLAADGKTVLKNPPLALDLHYLLTVYGSDNWQSEALLGQALMMIQQYPVIARADITKALGFLPAGGFSTALQNSGLADQIEMIKITPETLGREEMAWLWTALKADYRLTFPFQVSVVLMQPETPVGLPLPVLSRSITANAIQPAQLLQISIPDQQISAASGDLVTITGEFLKGASQVIFTYARLGIEMPANVSAATNNSLQFTVPTETALKPFPAGIYKLAVNFLDSTGNVSQTTGSLPIAVAPVIQLAPPPTVVQSATDTLVTLTFSPNAQPNQGVTLSIGSQSATAQPFATATDKLTFQFVPPLPLGKQLARLVVDGAPSQVKVNWPTTPGVLPTFDQTTWVTI